MSGIRIAVALVLSLACAQLLRADTVQYTVTPVAGEFEYAFTFANQGSTGAPLDDLFVSLDFVGAVYTPASFSEPPGWDPFPVPGSHNFGFFWDAAGPSNYLGIGDSLSGFSLFTPEVVDAPITFQLYGTGVIAPFTGTAQEVPEAGSLSSTSIALVVLSGLLALSRRRQAAAVPDKWCSKP